VKKLLLTLALTGCSGAFSSIGEPSEASVPDGDAPHDSGGAESLADAAGDAGESTPDADAGEVSLTDSGPACCVSPTAACSYPLASCPIAAENHGSFPSYFEVFMVSGENCLTVQTTDACLCDYTCGCIVPTFQCPAGGVQCTSDPIQGVLITCNQ
jgi:hypothetical protein